MMERRKNLNDKFGFVVLMKIKDFMDFEQPNEYIVESDRYSNECSTPVLTAGQSFILGYTNEGKGIYKKGPCIIFDDFTTSVHYVDFPFKVKSSAMKILTAKSNADLKYCYYLLLSLSKMPPNHKRQWISTTSEKNHVLPSMDRQISIVKQLDLISDTIVNYTNQIENLDNLVKARFIEMFGDPENNPNGWTESPLSEKLNVLGGFAFKSDKFSEISGIPILRIGNINSGHFKPVNMVYWKEDENLERYLIYPGDLVMSLTGTVGKDDYGNVCILGDDFEKYYLNQRNAKLEIQGGINKFYLSQLLKFKQVKKKLTGISRGVRQANISNKDILNLVVPIPPIELQNQFADFVKQVDKSREEVKKALEKTQQLYDSLMQEYFG